MFGNAAVYGHFVINNSVSTFCGKSSFLDIDDGSNMLFYIATDFRVDDRLVFVERVHYIVAGEGVLIHNQHNTSSSVYLPRVTEDEAEDNKESSYDQNMLVGVTAPTTLSPTDGDYTNLILYQGAFHPISGGQLGANKAYLQVLTEDYNRLPAGASLSYVYDDTNTVKAPADVPQAAADIWYTLSGQRLSAKPNRPGIYLHQGKTILMR